MNDFEILLADGNTRKEAEKRIEKQSYIIYRAEEFERKYMLNWVTSTDAEDREEEFEIYQSMVKENIPAPDWSICEHEGIKYLIAYEN